MDINKAFQLAQEYHNSGNLRRAEQTYREILDCDPSNFEAYYEVANVFQDAGRLEDAIVYYQKALGIRPNHFEAHYNLGVACGKKGDVGKAIDSYKKALEFKPDLVEAHCNLGNAYRSKGLFDEAITYYLNSLRIDPTFSGALSNLGLLYQDKGQINEAITCFQKAVQVSPSSVGAHNNLGIAFIETGRLDEAMTCFQETLRIDPYFNDALNNMGTVFKLRGQIDRAIRYFQMAIQLDRNFAAAHYNLSLALLLSGNLKQGWKEFEWRWKVENMLMQRYFPQPLWDGSSLKGKSLFVHSEQGIGEEIMFASCLPDVLDLTDSCIVECDNRLVPLFSRSFPKVQAIEHVGAHPSFPAGLPQIDFVISCGTLPLFFRPEFSGFPQKVPYLTADPYKINEWLNRLSELGEGMKVGISWRGGGKSSVRRVRSTALSQWAGLLSLKGLHFVNLQYGETARELDELRENFGITVHHWEDVDPLKNLDAFAAQIAALDLVISVDNSTVHMAGALGKPVWVLLPHIPEWRWMLNREDSPWYPTMRLFRQPAPGDWEPVMARIENEILELLGGK